MNWKRLLLPVVILALGIGGFAALKATQPKRPPIPPKEQVWRVEAVTVELRSQSPVLTLNGKVESPELTRAAAPAMGRIARLPVREGQAVGKGQLLLEMDSRDFLPRVEQARGEVDELRAALRGEELRHAADLDQLTQERRLLGFAAAEVARFERLQEENFYSQAAVDQGLQNLTRQNINLRSRELAIADHQTRLGQLKARLMRAEANLDQAQLAHARSRVTAPFDGLVAGVEVAEGDQVNTGQVLLSLYPQNGLEVRAKIPAPYQEEMLAEVGSGKRLAAQAELGSEKIALRLVRLSAAADSRGLDGFFAPVRSAANLRVGSLLSLQLSRRPVPDAIALPYSALYGGKQVYKLEEGRLNAAEVETLGELPGARPRLLVRSPALAQGDRVLITHLPNAVTGLRVEVAP